jgi:hypothetical protein
MATKNLILCSYATGRDMRVATQAEADASAAAALVDGGEGRIVIAGVECYVDERAVKVVAPISARSTRVYGERGSLGGSQLAEDMGDYSGRR